MIIDMPVLTRSSNEPSHTLFTSGLHPFFLHTWRDDLVFFCLISVIFAYYQWGLQLPFDPSDSSDLNANGQIPPCDMPAGNHVTAVVVFIISDWIFVLMNNHGSLRARLKRE